MSRILEMYRFLVDMGEVEPGLLDELDEVEIARLEAEGAFEDPNGFFNCVQTTEPTATDWIREPVSPAQFMSDPYYAGESVNALYPKLREVFEEIFLGKFHEVILAGAISYGKTYFMAWCMFRQLYELSCLSRPQSFLGIAPGTPIVMANLSVTGQQAKNACFNNVKVLVDSSPYFQEHFARDDGLDAVLKFPNNILYQPGNSSEFSAIGTNLIAGAVDEANFLVSAKKLAHERFQAADVNHAAILYRALATRIELRFKASRGWKGRLFLASSRIYDGDFIDQQIKTKTGNPGVKILDMAHWEVFGFTPGTKTFHPHTKELLFSGETFQVAIGHSGESSRILKGGESLAEDTEVITVPVEYWGRFAKSDDLEGAIRDIAGRGTFSVNPWIANRKAIDIQAVTTYAGHPLVHPFPDDTRHGLVVEEGLAEMLNLDALCLSSRTMEGRGVDMREIVSLVPRRAPDTPRYVRFDLALRNDAVGMAMGYPAGYTTTTIRPAKSVDVEIREVPIIVFELLAKFTAPIGGEVEFGFLRDVLYMIRDVGGFSIASVTFDQFQSADSRQILASMGFETEELSVDRDVGPYSMLRNGIVGGWVFYYPHETTTRELKKLQRVVTGDTNKRLKVDHPELDPENPHGGKGSKDCADAMAGVVAKILEVYQSNVAAPAPLTGGYQPFIPKGAETWLDPQSSWLVADYVKHDTARHLKKMEQKRNRPR